MAHTKLSGTPKGQLTLKPTKILGKDFTQLGKVIRFAFYMFISASAMSPWLPSRTISAFSLNINPFLEPTTWPSSLLTVPHLLLQDQLAAHVVIITGNCVCSASCWEIALWGRWGPVLWLLRSHRLTHWVSKKPWMSFYRSRQTTFKFCWIWQNFLRISTLHKSEAV